MRRELSQQNDVTLAGSASGACFAALLALLEPSHGPAPQLAAQVFKPLTAVLLGLGPKGAAVAGVKPAAAAQKLRDGALGFLSDALR